jgi:pyruvate kinase
MAAKEVSKAAKKKPIKVRKYRKKSCIIVLKPKKAILHSLKINSGIQALVPIVQKEEVQITTKSGRKVQLIFRAKLSET